MLLFKTLLLIRVLGTCKGDQNGVPVFLLDYDAVMKHLKIESNPFAKITTTFFTEVVQDVIKNSKTVIIFIEDTFCAEDISTKDTKGTAYYHLRQRLSMNHVKYLPNVVEPFSTLRQIFQLHDLNVFFLSDTNTKLKIYDAQYSHYYVYFVDGQNETRTELLRRHDAIIREVFFVFQQLTSGPVVAFYTGKTNPIIVERLERAPLKRVLISRDPGITIESRGALFRFIGVYTSSASRYARFSQTPVIVGETWTRRDLSTKVAYNDFDLQFNFSFKKDGWTVDNVALLEGGEEVGRSEVGAGAPWGWSYVCGEPLVVVNTRDGSAVTISHYQIQPFRRSVRSSDDWSNYVKADDDATDPPPAPEQSPAQSQDNGADSPKTFGKSVNCGPYFNTVIISGLLVSFLCLGALTFAVTVIYNCNTNSRYDDPQGKQLVIIGEGMQ